MRRHNDADRPVIRTFYDHFGPVNEVAFHPNGLTLASCSDDRYIKLYDLTRTGNKRGFRAIHDSHGVNSISFHPCGDFLAAGTDDTVLRVHDLHQGTCYVTSRDQGEQHRGPIRQVRYAPSANMLVTCSDDGDVRLWDGVTGRCVRTFRSVHSGRPVSSALITKNEKYLLTSGCDSAARLWDLGTGGLIRY
jgi:cleavage stimulation factor subunit 1